MDTRRKIVNLEECRAAAPGPTVVTGSFDPMTAPHAVRLEEIRAEAGGPLVVVICNAEEAILPLRARAELVAALRVVDYVVTAERSVEDLIVCLQPSRVYREEPADSRRTQQLIERIRERNCS